jgi:choline dehydrogenase-like flavoprotein
VPWWFDARVAERTRVLAAVADTFVASFEADGDDETAVFLRRSASDAGVPALLAGVIDGDLDSLLSELGEAGFVAASDAERRRLIRGVGARGGGSRQRLRVLKGAVMGAYYGAADEQGRNPVWPALGYPGPISVPPTPEQAPKTIRVEPLAGDAVTFRSDAVVVGSGAGGSVVAAELQAAGLDVVIVEQGGYRNESDFRQLEGVAAAEMYLRGGLFWSESGSIGILAGATLGGGTVINSMVCLRPPGAIRRDWAARGLDGLDGASFDADLDAVAARLNVNTERTIPNRTNQLMAEALDARGLPWETLPRNVTDDDDPAFCGYCNAGCQQGCKRSTLQTYLQDASDHGARVVVDCAVERVLVEDGRAAGVVARAAGDRGQDVAVTVSAPVVVVAAGGVETPAILLRSGIGGPAVGKHLRLHPAYFVGGVYDEDVQPWRGQFQALACLAFADPADGSGFLIESVNVSLPFWAGALPFTNARAHKERMLRLRNVASWHGLTHDHGSGDVVLDHDGEALVRWGLDDPVDRRTAAQIHVELARMHLARGAREIMTFHWDDLTWREGDDRDAWLARLGQGPHDGTAYSAHQMGSCRMGADASTTVADGRGELHDAPGVWIGDAAGLPTAPGVNPMLTIMALARRTARAILADHGRTPRLAADGR